MEEMETRGKMSKEKTVCYNCKEEINPNKESSIQDIIRIYHSRCYKEKLVSLRKKE